MLQSTKLRAELGRAVLTGDHPKTDLGRRPESDTSQAVDQGHHLQSGHRARGMMVTQGLDQSDVRSKMYAQTANTIHLGGRLHRHRSSPINRGMVHAVIEV